MGAALGAILAGAGNGGVAWCLRYCTTHIIKRATIIKIRPTVAIVLPAPMEGAGSEIPAAGTSSGISGNGRAMTGAVPRDTADAQASRTSLAMATFARVSTLAPPSI